MDADTKRCPKCRETKPHALFSKNASKADGLHSHCKACRATHYAAHRKSAAAYSVAYYAANREKKVAYNAAWRATHRDQIAAYNAANGAAIAEKDRRWRAANPDKTRTQQAIRRARKATTAAATTPQERAAVREVYRKAELAEAFTGIRMAVDHRHPVALGGSSLAVNLQHLPYSLNAAKHARTHEEALATVPGYADWCEGPPQFN